jgi:hypothetical protein
MDDEPVQITMSAEEFGQFLELLQTFQVALSAGITGREPMGRFVTVDERCAYRWPLATAEHRRRIRDVCLAKYRDRLGRYPYKLTGHPNGAYLIEIENVALLDRSIDLVRNEAEARDMMPLFRRKPR